MTVALRAVLSSLRSLWVWLHTPTGSKMVRYSLASVVSVAVGELLLLLTYGVLRWSAVEANLFATAVASLPSYYLNRRWVWRKVGRSHLMKEVVPFWVLAFIGLALSTFAVDIAERWSRDLGLSHAMSTAMVNVAALAAFGVVWVGKFLIFNHLMFIDRSRPEKAWVTATATATGGRVEEEPVSPPLTAETWR